MKEIYYVTTNSYKYKIAVSIFKDNGLDKIIKLNRLNISCPEIQDEKVENIALYSARWAAKKTGKTVITSDSGFSIVALKNFPGPFVKYINNWLSPKDIISLLKNKSNKKAFFIDALAYADQSGNEKVFCSRTYGQIIEKYIDNGCTEKSGGWSVDSIFIPRGFTKVISKLNNSDKLKVWNISRWLKFKNYIKKNEKTT